MDIRRLQRAWLMVLVLAMTPTFILRAQDSWQVAKIRFGEVEPPVVLQSDITVRAPYAGSNTEIKSLESGSLAWLDGTLVFVSDRHQQMLFIATLNLDTLELGTPKPLNVTFNDQYLLDDMEAITVRRLGKNSWMAYAICSLSNDPSGLPLPKRRHFLRVRLERQADGSLKPYESTVINASPFRNSVNQEFINVGVEPYRTYSAEYQGADKNTYRWGNIEGITFTPDAKAMVFAMRNPLLKGKALLGVAGKVDTAFDSEETGLELTDMFTLDLKDRGVCDIAWDPVTRGYLIAAAKSNGPKLDNDQPFPPNDLKSALFWWSGNKKDAPIQFADIPDMKIEGICRLGDSRYIAFVTDEGDVSESRPHAQSTLVVMDFTGLTPAPKAAGGRSDD